jgi:hypothetical protein
MRAVREAFAAKTPVQAHADHRTKQGNEISTFHSLPGRRAGRCAMTASGHAIVAPPTSMTRSRNHS